MLNPRQIQAITLDLDDTLWPVWPAIERAEHVLLQWMHQHAPRTADRFSTTQAWRAIRMQVEQERPDLHKDLSGMRKESIRRALLQTGEDPALAEPAFDTFFAQRQKVEFYDDALPALQFLASRWPLIAVSNGNADVHAVGVGRFFVASLNVGSTGFAKPDPRMFQAAAAVACVPLAAILHVGDDAALDAKGAMNAGMQAAWLNRGGIAWGHSTQEPHATVPDLHALCALLK